MSSELKRKKVAILVTDGFEQVEMTRPRKSLDDAGASTELISPNGEGTRAWDHGDWGDEFPVDVEVADADPGAYDALLLPGGVMNADRLRILPEVQRFVRAFFEAAKPVGAIGHAAWMLIDAGVVRGRRVASCPTLRTDLTNAGAQCVDQDVVVDRGLATSREPRDVPEFSRKMIEAIAEARPAARSSAVADEHPAT